MQLIEILGIVVAIGGVSFAMQKQMTVTESSLRKPVAVTGGDETVPTTTS